MEVHLGEKLITTSFTQARVFRTIAPDRIESGVGSLNNLPKIVSRLKSSRILIATSNSVMTKTPHIEGVQALLGEDVSCIFPTCRQHSPETDIVALIDQLKSDKNDGVVSIGGSSVFDTVKVATSRLANERSCEPIPQIAIPTTLSAGEFTAGAGYTDGSGAKQLVLDLRVSPRCVILDPNVTVETPEILWLSTGMKALDHAIEAVWSRRPHPYVNALSLEAIRLLTLNLPASRDSANLEARAACQMAAWMSIAGVGASGMRLSHFLGHQIGARMHIPHGITSCILLPAVMRHLRDETLGAQCRIAEAMGLDDTGFSAEQFADHAADELEGLIRSLGLPASISEAGGSLEDIDAVARSSHEAAEILGLTHDLPDGEKSVRTILMQAWK